MLKLLWMHFQYGKHQTSISSITILSRFKLLGENEYFYVAGCGLIGVSHNRFRPLLTILSYFLHLSTHEHFYIYELSLLH